MNISTKTAMYSIYDKTNGKTKHIGDTNSYKRPDIEMLTDTFTGTGIMGEIDIPTIGQIGAMEGELGFNKTTVEMAELFAPGVHTIESRWVTSVMDTATGNVRMQGNKEIIKIQPKKISLGEVKSNETNESSMTYEILSYQYLIDGKTIIKIDKLNFVFIINGVDYTDSIRKLL